MINLLEKVKLAAANAKDASILHSITVEQIDTELGAWERAAGYAASKRWTTIGIVTDETIHAKYEARIKKTWMSTNITSHLCLIKPDEQGDVVADECSIVQVMVDLPLSVDVYVVL